MAQEERRFNQFIQQCLDAPLWQRLLCVGWLLLFLIMMITVMGIPQYESRLQSIASLTPTKVHVVKVVPRSFDKWPAYFITQEQSDRLTAFRSLSSTLSNLFLIYTAGLLFVGLWSGWKINVIFGRRK